MSNQVAQHLSDVAALAGSSECYSHSHCDHGMASRTDDPVSHRPCHELKHLLTFAWCQLQWVDEDDEGDEKEDFDMSGMQNMQNVRRRVLLTHGTTAPHVSPYLHRWLPVHARRCSAQCPSHNATSRACLALSGESAGYLQLVLRCRSVPVALHAVRRQCVVPEDAADCLVALATANAATLHALTF